MAESLRINRVANHQREISFVLSSKAISEVEKKQLRRDGKLVVCDKIVKVQHRFLSDNLH